MENENLKQLIKEHKNKTNKELSNIVLTLEMEFNTVKNTVIELTKTMEEIETAYNTVLEELQNRLQL